MHWKPERVVSISSPCASRSAHFLAKPRFVESEDNILSTLSDYINVFSIKPALHLQFGDALSLRTPLPCILGMLSVALPTSQCIIRDTRGKRTATVDEEQVEQEPQEPPLEEIIEEARHREPEHP